MKATFFLLQVSLIEWVSRSIESDVHCPGMPLNWVSGKTPLVVMAWLFWTFLFIGITLSFIVLGLVPFLFLLLSFSQAEG